jgi:putative toxin-antitoxin system antitoxin component (TIGR02293 family)
MRSFYRVSYIDPIWKSRCTAPMLQKDPLVALTKPPHSALAADKGDLELFMGMDQAQQTCVIREGFEPIVVTLIARELLDVQAKTLLESLRMPNSAIARKKSSQERLSASEGDRVARVLMTFAHARDVFEDAASAAEWMKSPHAELDDEPPLAMLDTQSGFDRIRDLLMRIEFGGGV